jgi:hypothetical protein
VSTIWLCAAAPETDVHIPVANYSSPLKDVHVLHKDKVKQSACPSSHLSFFFYQLKKIFCALAILLNFKASFYAARTFIQFVNERGPGFVPTMTRQILTSPGKNLHFAVNFLPTIPPFEDIVWNGPGFKAVGF